MTETSASLRQLVARAHDALSRIEETLANDTSAADELERVVGSSLVVGLRESAAAVSAAHVRLASAKPSSDPPASRVGRAMETAKTLGDRVRIAERRAALNASH